jgi:hypothetical protein
MWSIPDIVDAVAAGLRHEEQRLAEEQAVYGLDALDELGLHPLLAQSLQRAGLGVYREERYPAHRRTSKAGEGERCDLVLTPARRPLTCPEEPPTLFDDADAVELRDAFWMEVKLVAQFTTKGPNRGYSSHLLAAVPQDVVKLSSEPGIVHAGLLIVLFAQDEAIAYHDLDAWQDRCLQRALPIAGGVRQGIRVADRLGNSVCKLAVIPVHHA